MIDVTKLSDLELAKLLTEQQQLLFQTNENLKLLHAELSKRLEKKNEISATTAKSE